MDSRSHLAAAAAAASSSAATAAEISADGGGDPLLRLAALGDRMAAVRRRLAASLSGASHPLSPSDLHSVSAEISSAAHLVVLHAASLLSSSVPFPPPPPLPPTPTPPHVQELASAPQEVAVEVAGDDDGYEVVELDAEELLAEHVHFCEICGKGFRRDANLRMHMRAHGDRFKTLDALSRPGQPKTAAAATGCREVRFSCPFAGCNRNRAHRRFRPLKSAVCARNHFRRSHCPKMYACERCGGKKRFAVLADLRSHLRHCGEEAQWRCSCGTTFSRKDKLFGHLALFEGHMPAVGTGDVKEKGKEVAALAGGVDETVKRGNADPQEGGEEDFDPDFIDEWMAELGSGVGGANWPGPAPGK